MLFAVTLVNVGIHCNCCESKQTTAAILHQGGHYKHLRATFHAYRGWVFQECKFHWGWEEQGK